MQLQGTDYTLAAANPPFRFVAVKTCKADALSALSYFPFPLAANATGVLAQALARRQLRIAARQSPLPSPDSSQFPSTCSSSPLMFGCSNVAC